MMNIINMGNHGWSVKLGRRFGPKSASGWSDYYTWRVSVDLSVSLLCFLSVKLEDWNGGFLG